MKIPKVLAILGIVLLVLKATFIFAPATQEVWEPKSDLLAK